MDASKLDVLLISPTGMLGRAWSELLTARSIRHSTVGRPVLDLARPETLSKAVADHQTHVVNCAAYTNVDGAEEDEPVATQINGAGVGALATRCREIGAQLVHYSTDYVFSGNAQTPYRTDEPRAPLNAYGRSKAAGEEAIEASGCSYLILRTSWVYASWGNNFVLTMARLSDERRRLTVVNDQRGRPTSATYLAERSLMLMEADANGIHHVTDGGECTWCDFTQEIVSQLGRTCAVEPCTSDAFPRPAKRPAYSVLDLSRTESLIGPARPWQENLKKVLDHLPTTVGSDRHA